MEDFTLADLGVFLGVVGGILTSLLLTLQKSNCVDIQLCCFKCKRDPNLIAKSQGAKPPVLQPEPEPESA